MLAPAVNHILLGPPRQPGKGPTPRGRPNADYPLPASFTWLNARAPLTPKNLSRPWTQTRDWETEPRTFFTPAWRLNYQSTCRTGIFFLLLKRFRL